METKRKCLLEEIWTAQNTAYDLMCEYDSLPHRYGANTLYQAEAHVIYLIALHPDITISDLANILRKTPSACSQMVRKLRAKGWVEQTRNEANNRLVNLRLTEEGKRVYQDHADFETNCQALTFQLLAEFSEQELAAHLAVQKRINAAYQDDIRRSREYFA